MIKILILKEIRLYFASPRFVAVFLICALLILLSIQLGIQEYQAAVAQYETATQLAAQDIHERNSWDGTETRVFRAPDPMQIFVNGLIRPLKNFQFFLRHGDNLLSNRQPTRP